jgi:hypothetical protein
MTEHSFSAVYAAGAWTEMIDDLYMNDLLHTLKMRYLTNLNILTSMAPVISRSVHLPPGERDVVLVNKKSIPLRCSETLFIVHSLQKSI